MVAFFSCLDISHPYFGHVATERHCCPAVQEILPFFIATSQMIMVHARGVQSKEGLMCSPSVLCLNHEHTIWICHPDCSPRAVLYLRQVPFHDNDVRNHWGRFHCSGHCGRLGAHHCAPGQEGRAWQAHLIAARGCSPRNQASSRSAANSLKLSQKKNSFLGM